MTFEKLYPDMISYAKSEYPKEACGIVSDNNFIPISNLADNPTEDFRMPTDILYKYNVQAIYHSHPDSSAAPSAQDMQSQINTNVPWIISSVTADSATTPYQWGSDTPIPDLIGREFRHGPSGTDNRGDCYALIKDYYQLKLGITLPEFPRDYSWWERDDDLYNKHFEEAGFIEIPIEEVQDNDVFLMAINSKYLNHGGVILDNCQLIIHHLTGRLSRKEPLGRWTKYIKKWLRYIKNDSTK